MLKPDSTILSVIDVQGRLAHAMYNKETLFENLQKLIKGVKIFGIPILWTEQNPEGLGPTIPEVANLLSDISPISKLSFSCCGNECFMEALRGLNRNQVLLAGIEAHVCVYQTAVDLVNLGISEAASAGKEPRDVCSAPQNWVVSLFFVGTDWDSSQQFLNSPNVISDTRRHSRRAL